MTGARLSRIVLNVVDVERARGFYREALGFDDRGDGTMRLGAQEFGVELIEAHGTSYPRDSRSSDLWFQHFAIAVDDMDAAYARLARRPDFRPITRGGPQRLPPNTGSVVAFKFRDPDGHPLELLNGRGLAHGIDHSAIAVSDIDRSIAFYAQVFGLSVVGRSLNRGVEQARLDDLEDPMVDVVALGTQPLTKPHLELLGYRTPRGRPMASAAAPGDVATTRLVFEGPEARVLRDPDGHWISAAAAPGGLPRATHSP